MGSKSPPNRASRIRKTERRSEICATCHAELVDRPCPRSGFHRLGGRLPVFLIPEQQLALAVALHGEINDGLRARTGFDIQVRLLAASHATEEVFDVRDH